MATKMTIKLKLRKPRNPYVMAMMPKRHVIFHDRREALDWEDEEWDWDTCDHVVASSTNRRDS